MCFKQNQLTMFLLTVILCTVMSGMACAEQESTSFDISLGYGISVQISDEYAANLEHMQKIHFTPVTEVFVVYVDGKEIPLYRIDFGNETVGEWLGVIQMEEGDVPVTYTLYPLSEEGIAAMNEEDRDSYYSAMESFNLVLEAVRADLRFAEQYTSEIGEIRELTLKYWTLMLPEGIACNETFEDGMYTAVFYGKIRGEKTVLFTVNIGGDTEKTVGMYNVGDEKKSLSIEIHTPGFNVFWTDADYEMFYRMLESVNDVMDVITADEKFD